MHVPNKVNRHGSRTSAQTVLLISYETGAGVGICARRAPWLIGYALRSIHVVLPIVTVDCAKVGQISPRWSWPRLPGLDAPPSPWPKGSLKPPRGRCCAGKSHGPPVSAGLAIVGGLSRDVWIVYHGIFSQLDFLVCFSPSRSQAVYARFLPFAPRSSHSFFFFCFS